MGIRAEVIDDGSEVVIAVEGRFDFSAHRDFRDSYEKVSQPMKRYTVDLRDTSYLDSSALGMLLLLRDHAGGDAAEVRIVNCSPNVRKILKVSNFEQLFNIR